VTPDGDCDRERDEVGGETHEEERSRHPAETGEDERLGPEPVDEDTARKRADAEQPVSEGDDQSEDRRRRRELTDPYRQQDRDRELIGVNEPV